MLLIDGAHIPQADLRLLCHILNAAWGDMTTVTPAQLETRFQSGQLFLAGRDHGRLEELEYIRSTYGIEPPSGWIPLGLVETIDALTGGDPSRLPRTWSRLTSQGDWRLPRTDADTLVLVDLTVAASRRGSGLGELLLTEALRRRRPELKYVFTYSPHDPAVLHWHEHRGALPSGVVFKDARPGHAVTDVTLMDYTEYPPPTRLPLEE